MGPSLVKVTPIRNKFVSVFSSPSSMRLRISLSELWTHLSQVLAVSDPFSAGGNEFGMALSTGCAAAKETNWGVCARAWQNVKMQKKDRQSDLPSLLGIGISTGRAPGKSRQRSHCHVLIILCGHRVIFLACHPESVSYTHLRAHETDSYL